MPKIDTQRARRAAPDARHGGTVGASARANGVPSVAAGRTADGTDRLGRPAPIDASKLTRGGRVRKWDRVPPPKDWRWYVGNLGKTLITVGLLMFGFVGYQLYGTGIETAAAQSELQDQFAQKLSAAPPVAPDLTEDADSDPVVQNEVDDDIEARNEIEADDEVAVDDEIAFDDEIEADDEVAVDDVVPEADPFVPADEAVAPPAVPAAAQNIPVDLANGDALAKIQIPRIGLDDIVVAGVETSDLKRGPGHFPDTPLPGQLGNAAIAGHRTTYGQPFRNVDQLQNGDEIKVTTLSGVFVYKVTGQTIVDPSDYEVVATTDPTVATLTLTSCHPVFTARQRIVIFSELDRTESAPVGEPVLNYGRAEALVPATEIPGDLDVPTGDETTDDETAADEIIGDETTSADVADEPVVPDTVDNSTGTLGNDTRVPVEPGSVAANEGIADAFSVGWFSDPSANSQVGIWGAVLGAIAIAAYAISRRFRRDLLGLAVGLVPFTLALYFFFQNVNRLLPPNL